MPSPLEQRVRSPYRQLTLSELAGQWFHALVAVRASGAGVLAHNPRAPGWVRGAWGEQLKQTASAEAIAGQPCTWQPPCSLDVFFRRQGHVTPGLEIAKPYTVGLAADDGDLIVELRVFGFATDWLESAADALVRALRQGIRAPDGSQGLTVADRQTQVFEGLEIPPAAPRLALEFQTPLALRRDEPSAPLMPSLIASLGNRVSSLARWQDAAIAADWPAIKATAQALASHEQFEPYAGHDRSSARQQGRRIPVEGQRGTLRLAGDLDPLLPLLAIGQTCHAGSHAALGQGRYRIAVD